METEKKCSNNFCSCRKTPARPEVMRLANGNDFLPTASIMGQFLPPSPSRKTTDLVCEFWTNIRSPHSVTTDSALRFTFPPYSVSPNLVCPYLSYLSANYSIPSSQRCPTYPLPYLSIFYSSILILYLPISKLSAYNSYLSLLLCPSLPQFLPSYFSVLVILPKMQCPPLFSPYDNFKFKKKNSAQKPNYSLEQWKSTPSLC